MHAFICCAYRISHGHLRTCELAMHTPPPPRRVQITQLEGTWPNLRHLRCLSCLDACKASCGFSGRAAAGGGALAKLLTGGGRWGWGWGGGADSPWWRTALHGARNALGIAWPVGTHASQSL